MRWLAALPLLLAGTLSAAPQAAVVPIPIELAVPVERYPHDPLAYTEGLFIDRGELFESTGMTGRSSVRRVDLASGKVLQSAVVPPPYFGEGIAPWQGQVLSLTWQNHTGFRWDRQSLRQTGRFAYKGEGWALTSTGSELVMSDGTAVLRFVDPKTFRVKRRIAVSINGRSLDQLNELEWIKGEIYANIWMTDYVARIDPATGKVKGLIDLSRLHTEAGAFGPDQVANGIAFDARTGKLYFTGKEWPALFEVRLEPAGVSG